MEKFTPVTFVVSFLMIYLKFSHGQFYESTMSSYMMKEYVGGSFGIETRYPFLDRMVVQSFVAKTRVEK